jgi:hypothetical protein
MMGIERLAVMFGGCSSYRSDSRSTGGDALSRVEVAGMLTGMRPHEVDFVYAFFGDKEAELRLVAHLSLVAHELAKREAWKAIEDAMLERMAYSAVREILDKRCKACKGTGFKGIKACCQCGGIGMSRIKDNGIARWLQVDPSNYSRVWKRRYDCVFVYVQDIEFSVKSIIRRSEGRDAILLA